MLSHCISFIQWPNFGIGIIKSVAKATEIIRSWQDQFRDHHNKLPGRKSRAHRQQDHRYCRSTNRHVIKKLRENTWQIMQETLVIAARLPPETYPVIVWLIKLQGRAERVIPYPTKRR